MNIIETTRAAIQQSKEYVRNTPWRADYEAEIARILFDLDTPCELAVVGQVKAGKSSFINALLGEELAIVDVTEATATINYFRYGLVKDKSRPIKVIWNDGREEWQTREFLDSLQGNTQEVLERASKIDHLEYFIPNEEILGNITIVDTPGTDSVVKEHSNRLADYLAQQNSWKSNNIKQRADAVIVLVGHVQRMGDEEVVNKFTDANNSFNFIGVMSKIDNEWEGRKQKEVSLKEEYGEWSKKCAVYSEKLNSRLHSIHPVSALLYQTLEQLIHSNRLAEIQHLIRQVDDKDFLDNLLSSSTAFEKEFGQEIENELKRIGLSFETRKFMKGSIPFPIFRVIAYELYENELDVAIGNLRRFAGMDQLKDILQKQFFNRSRIIRCYSSLQKVHTILNDIMVFKIPNLRRNAPYKEKISRSIDNLVLGFCNSSSDKDNIKKLLLNAVEANFWTVAECEKQIGNAEAHMRELEQIMNQLKEPNSKAEGLLLLQQNRNLFSEDKVKQLESILDGNDDKTCVLTLEAVIRIKSYWFREKEYCDTDSNEGVIRKKIIELVIKSCDSLIHKMKSL